MPESPLPGAASDLAFRDRAVRLGDSLVLADLHLGKGATSQLDFPVGDTARTVERVEALLAWADPDELVLAGDILHSFGTVPRTVRDAVDAIRVAAADHGSRVIALEGNHDTMLESVWDGDLQDAHRIDDTVVCHGHEPPELAADRYLIGHDHPVLAVEGRRRPCYLVGEGVYDGADVVVLPAFSTLLRGVAVNAMDAEAFMSPLVADAESFAPVVWDDDAREVLPFPPLGSFRERL